MTAILKQFQATPPPASVKAVEEICVTCGGAHSYYQCFAADGNTFPEFRDNIQGYVSVATVNYNQASVKAVEEICVTCGGAHSYYQCFAADGNTFPEFRDNIQGYVSVATVNYNQGNSGYRPPGVLRNEMKTSIQVSMSNQTNELKNMMASFFQMNTASTSGLRPLPSNTIANPKGESKAITTQSGLVLDGPSVLIPPPFINLEEDERVEETLTDQDLAEYNIKKMVKALLSNKEKLLELENTPLNKNYSAVILKKLPEKLGDPGNFQILCGFSELECKALADLANRAICTPAEIASDFFVSVGKFTFPADFVIVDYESDPRVPLILGRPFLRTAHSLIDVHEEEMILRDGDERLTLNMRHATSSYSNQPKKESINMINIYDDSCEDYLKDLFATNHLSGNLIFSSHIDLTSSEVKDDIFDLEGDIVLLEKLLNLDSTKDLPPPHNINPLSGSTTSSSPNQLLEDARPTMVRFALVA
nr:hypothetical protein [Tanacetum cinerariifolium]